MKEIIQTIKKLCQEHTNKKPILLMESPEDKGSKIYIKSKTEKDVKNKTKIGLDETWPVNTSRLVLYSPNTYNKENLGRINPNIIEINGEIIKTEEAVKALKDLSNHYFIHESQVPWHQRSGESKYKCDLWDDDWEDTIFTSSDWIAHHGVDIQALKLAIDNLDDTEQLKDVLNSIEWGEVSTDMRDYLVYLHELGAITLETSDIIVEKQREVQNTLPRSPLWFKNVKLIVPTMMKREYLYTFLLEDLKILQDNIKAIKESLKKTSYKDGLIVTTPIGFTNLSLHSRIMLEGFLDYNLDQMNGKDLIQVHYSTFGIRRIIAHEFKENTRGVDEVEIKSSVEIDQYMDEDENDTSRVIYGSALEMIDMALVDYLAKAIENIRIAEGLSRSLLLNPIKYIDNDQVTKIIMEYPQIVFKVINNEVK